MPFLNILFDFVNIYGGIGLLLALAINLLIMMSYSSVVDSFVNCDLGEEEISSEMDPRINCPHFLYDDENDTKTINKIFDIFGLAEIIIFSLLFLDYFLRRCYVKAGINLNSYKINLIKRYKKNKTINITCCQYFLHILSPAILTS